MCVGGGGGGFYGLYRSRCDDSSVKRVVYHACQ